MKTYVLFIQLFLLVLSSTLHAHEAEMIFDPDHRVGDEGGSGPRQITPTLGKVFFTADERSAGRELWVSDESALGAHLVADVCTGSCDGNVEILATSGGALFFIGQVGFREWELWRTDGTPEGTWPLKRFNWHRPLFGESSWALAGGLLYLADEVTDFQVEVFRTDGTVAGTTSVLTTSEAAGFTALGSEVFFFSGFFWGDAGLWKSDGTAEGTEMVLPSVGRKLTSAGDLLFFNTAGQLYRSDGTEAGTFAVTDVEQGFFGELLGLDSRLYFSFGNDAYGEEIYVSDGTVAGTKRITDIPWPNAFPFALDADRVEEIGGKLIFLARGTENSNLEPWVTEGTPESTRQLADTRPGSEGGVSLETRVVGAHGRAYFIADDGTGAEVWRTDGTVAGTGILKETCPGSCFESAYHLTAEGDELLFIARDSDFGYELWRSDGTEEGTRPVTAFGRSNPFPQIREDEIWLATSDEVVYFAAYDFTVGEELWKVEGEAEASVVANIGMAQGSSSLQASVLVPLGDQLLFSACDGEDTHLWSTRGVVGDPVSLLTFPPGARDGCGTPAQRFQNAGDRVYFVYEEPRFANQVWTSDGTAEGTLRLTDFEAREDADVFPVAFRDRLYFPVARGGGEIWESDGTVEGTRRSDEFTALPMRTFRWAKVFGDRIFLAQPASPGSVYLNVWVTDGTAEGTRQLTEFSFWSAPEDIPFFEFDGQVFFVALNQLWMTDGTREGTRILGGFGGAVSSQPRDRAIFGGFLYVVVSDGGLRTLWKSDGTPEGTMPVRSFARLGLEELVVVGNHLFFVADDGIHGHELWKSDGSPQGTVLVKDILAGVGSSQLRDLVAVGGKLYFVASDGWGGVELWRSDGTEGGTVQVDDIAPGGLSSHPLQLVAVGGRLYFTADDRASGRELWTVSAGSDTPTCVASGTALCLGGNRFQVEIAWGDFAGRGGVGNTTPLSDDTGAFWFFRPDNLETVVKVIDGTGTNDHFWVFFGSLTNVGFTLSVTDTLTGHSKLYHNFLSNFASVGDIEALPRNRTLPPPAEDIGGKPTPAARAEGSCVPDGGTLCLGEGRFRLRVEWTDFSNNSGAGTAEALTADSGTFWFFRPGNVELMVKVIDGTDFNDRFWVFYGALTNVAFELTVEDTVTGATRVYRNPLGSFASVGDTQAF